MCAISRSMTFWHSYGCPILAEFLAATWSKNIFGILTQASVMWQDTSECHACTAITCSLHKLKCVRFVLESRWHLIL